MLFNYTLSMLSQDIFFCEICCFRWYLNIPGKSSHVVFLNDDPTFFFIIEHKKKSILMLSLYFCPSDFEVYVFQNNFQFLFCVLVLCGFFGGFFHRFSHVLNNGKTGIYVMVGSIVLNQIVKFLTLKTRCR